jgi:DNA-binding Lrp family transcriptional regulator
MSANKEEYVKIQGEILKFLFDNAKATTFGEISDLTKKPKSETEYHLDVLKADGLIQNRFVMSGSAAVRGFEITARGRKAIMER